MKALVIGATGATGRELIQVLLQDRTYKEILIFVRRKSGIAHPKLVEVLTDFDHLENVAQHIHGDVWFSCLGTTLKAAGSKEKQRQIDFDIPLQFAEIAKMNGVKCAVLLSAYGAAASSAVFYSQIKGKLEDAIAALSFDRFIIFRPGLLLRKDTDRMGERISAGLLNFINGLGLFRRFKPMPTSLLAIKLARSPKVLGVGMHVIELEKIFPF